MTIPFMADATPNKNDDLAELRRRQWEIVERLRQQDDPTSKEIAEVMAKILREIESEDRARPGQTPAEAGGGKEATGQRP